MGSDLDRPVCGVVCIYFRDCEEPVGVEMNENLTVLKDGYTNEIVGIKIRDCENYYKSGGLEKSLREAVPVEVVEGVLKIVRELFEPC